MTLSLELLAVAGLLLLNAFFVAAEYGLVTARRTRITELRDQGDNRARLVLRITANPPRFIAAMNCGGESVSRSTWCARRLPWCASSCMRVRRTVTRPYSAATKNAFTKISAATAMSSKRSVMPRFPGRGD